MKSERIRVSTDFAKQLRSEKERMSKALQRAGKKKDISMVQFTKLCKINSPSIVVPDLHKGGKKKARLEENYDIIKLI